MTSSDSPKNLSFPVRTVCSRAVVVAFATIAVMWSASSESKAQAFGAGMAEPYLQRAVGARALGMAGAYTSVANEAFGIFFNPAFSSFLDEQPTFSLMFAPLEFGRQQSSFAYGQTFGGVLGVSAGVNSISQPSFTGRRVNGTEFGTFSNEQYLFAANLSYRLESFSFGASGKYALNNLRGPDAARGQAFLFDAGARLDFLDLFTFGAAIQNVGQRMNWNTSAHNDKIPFTIRAGVSTEFGINEETYVVRTNVRGEEKVISIPGSQYILASLDVVYNQFDINTGCVAAIEYVPMSMLAVRAGAEIIGEDLGRTRWFSWNQWGAGVSFRPVDFDLPFPMQLDYSVSRDILSGFGIGHSLSIVLQL